MKAGSRKDRSVDLRFRIVEAASRRFAENGVAGSSIQSIARDVGISKQALMHHYPTKQLLREAVAARLIERSDHLIPLMLPLLWKKGQTDADLDPVLDFFELDPNWAKFMLRDLLNDQNPDFGEVITQGTAQAVKLFREAQNSGIIDPEADPEAAIATLGTFVLCTFATLGLDPGPHLESNATGRVWQRRKLRELLRSLQSSLRPQS
jgi:TetR/AcrR family transcriptional regulator